MDEPLPDCRICGEPMVGGPSYGGHDVCGWCDCGNCRYCGVRSMLLRVEIDGGRSLRNWREHMQYHKSTPPRAAAGERE